MNDDIIYHRDHQLEIKNSGDDMLQSVQINPTELCNRTCSFCPRHDKNIYPNQNKHIQVKTVENLCIALKEMKFNNRVGFVGFGEPLLCKTLIQCIRKVKEIIPDIKWLEVNTNGDKLTTSYIKELATAGCTHIIVSMYDSDKTDFFNIMKGDIKIKFVFRHHYNHQNEYNLNIVNRSDLLSGCDKIYNTNPCNIPFYKLFIDWNGDVLLCENNWKKDVIFGNINEESLSDIWYGSKINTYRNVLINNRDIRPCKNCSIGGKYRDRGNKSVELYIKNVKS
tara:strand:+ start:1764 stop:2603 length:840 start_codon:yes stop_codon:yes gene_type:complete